MIFLWKISSIRLEPAKVWDAQCYHKGKLLKFEHIDKFSKRTYIIHISQYKIKAVAVYSGNEWNATVARIWVFHFFRFCFPSWWSPIRQLLLRISPSCENSRTFSTNGIAASQSVLTLRFVAVSILLSRMESLRRNLRAVHELNCVPVSFSGMLHNENSSFLKIFVFPLRRGRRLRCAAFELDSDLQCKHVMLGGCVQLTLRRYFNVAILPLYVLKWEFSSWTRNKGKIL